MRLSIQSPGVIRTASAVAGVPFGVSLPYGGYCPDGWTLHTGGYSSIHT